MKCVVCQLNEAETTDCRCRFCVGKPYQAIIKSEHYRKSYQPWKHLYDKCPDCGVPFMYQNLNCPNHEK
jgi:hypothetical protein